MSNFMLEERCYLVGGFLLKNKQIFVYFESEEKIIYITIDGKLVIPPEEELLKLLSRKASTKIRISENKYLKINKKTISLETIQKPTNK